MLLNLSNHPSSRWNIVQLEAAQTKYGEVKDMPFPVINPDWTTEEVEALAATYVDKIQKEEPTDVHLMGEMTFTYALVNLLQEIGITCVASTSDRKVIEEVNGKKTVLFEFKQFRAYP